MLQLILSLNQILLKHYGLGHNCIIIDLSKVLLFSQALILLINFKMRFQVPLDYEMSIMSSWHLYAVMILHIVYWIFIGKSLFTRVGICCRGCWWWDDRIWLVCPSSPTWAYSAAESARPIIDEEGLFTVQQNNMILRKTACLCIWWVKYFSYRLLSLIHFDLKRVDGPVAISSCSVIFVNFCTRICEMVLPFFFQCKKSRLG